ncbi:MAG: leucine--tRNA ligase [Gammaproteobacteria bacterium]
MEEQYEPQAIEAKVQKYWEEKQVFQVKESLNKEKFYCLSMFPYPSGYLHVGHVRNYAIGDVISRYQRMKGKNVLQPFGWDAFGLPAENAAIKHKMAPAKWTYKNIDTMREQIKSLGFACDWSREIATCDPNYYQWEQWLFIQLFKKGIAYKKLSTVNWDPVDQTVLANEQVVNGCGWRSGAPIERRDIPQWFLKITDYADELLNDLEHLEEWPERVRTMQENWIGRSEGMDIIFNVENHDEKITVFTTRLDTLMGATYLCLSPEHELTKQAAKNNPHVVAFLEKCKNTKVAEADMANVEKIGVDTGFKAIHPLTGEALPIWTSNYVLHTYGSGAVMAVPAHDERDYEFANKYQLPMKVVIAPNASETPDVSENAYTEKGILINSGEYNDMDFQQAFDAISKTLASKKQGKTTVKYRLHDWGISRQRYWGAPIPMINCDDCGTVPVPEEDLPVKLPENVEFHDGPISLKDIPEFVNTICPKCGKAAKRETDTFDTFMESSWYYARYACPDKNNAMLDNRAKYWTPVDQYIGGIEHAVMHLLYARFMHKLLRDEGLLNTDEPFKRLLTQGMVLKDGAKMSKSKGNTVDPTVLIKEYGVDSLRLFVIFTAPPEQSLEWSDSGFEGSYRFLKRLWAFAYEKQHSVVNENKNPNKIVWERASNEQRDIRREMHLILQRASYDYERLQFNTVVSGCMKLLNLLTKLPSPTSCSVDGSADRATLINQYLTHQGMKILICLLAPIAPHICDVLWRELGYEGKLLDTPWPKVSTAALETQTVSMVVQINGKLRSKISVPTSASKEAIEAVALEDNAVKRYTQEKTVKKIIVVPNKLVNIVVAEA